MADATLPSFNSPGNRQARQRAIVKGKIAKIDTIEIDVVRDETHTLSNTVTDHPVEEGANITDHSRPDPDQVVLNCYVSNTPLSTDQMKRAANQAQFDNTLLKPDGSLQIAQVPTRAGRVFEALKKLRDEGTLISVVTFLKTYGVSSTEGMMILSLTVPVNAKNYDGLEWSINLKQVRIVRNRATRQPENKDPRANTKNSKGNQTPQTDEDLNSKLKNWDVKSGGALSNTLFGSFLR